MRGARGFLICVVAVCGGAFFSAASVCAGELIHSPHPLDQPLAVVRADEAGLFAGIAATRQARAFGLNEEDFSGKLPGTNVSTASLREFLNALAEAGARNLWYCLLQDGGTLARQTGGFGWEMDGADADVGADLESLGLEGGIAETRVRSSGDARVVIARDEATKEALTGGAFQRAQPWRTDLLKFLDRRDRMVGVLANSRPLSGLLSLATGVDFRSALARYGLRFPVSAQLELFANAGDLGFEARLNGLVPAPEKAAAAGRREVLSFQPEPLLEVNFPAPELLRRHLPFDTGVFALANLDASALIPQSINLTIWRKADGGLAWAIACLVADREAFRAQLRRVEAWAEALASGGAPAVELADAKSPDGHALRLLSGEKFSFVTGLADGEGKSGYFIISDSAESWVNPRTIHKQNTAGGRVMQYRAALDAAGRQQAGAALTKQAQRFGRNISAEAWEAALPEKDSGYLSVDDESLVLMSRNGLLPFLMPWGAEILGSF